MPLTADQQATVVSLLPALRPILAHFRADEDMEAAAHLAACEAVSRWRPGCGCNLRRYVFQSVRNRLTDFLRTQPPPSAPLDFPPEDPHGGYEPAFDLSRLSPRQRRIIVGKLVRGTPLYRLAKGEGISLRKARAIYRAAISRLRAEHGAIF